MTVLQEQQITKSLIFSPKSVYNFAHTCDLFFTSASKRQLDQAKGKYVTMLEMA